MNTRAHEAWGSNQNEYSQKGEIQNLKRFRWLAVLAITVGMAATGGPGYGGNSTSTGPTATGWTFFGTPGKGVNEFAGPVSIFVNGAGQIFVTDARNSRVVRINDMAGRGWTAFGTHGTGVNQFRFPFGISVGRSGQIFVTDIYRIVRVNDMNGSGWTTFGTRGTGVKQFKGLTGIFVTPAGAIFVADTGNNRIVRVDDMAGTGWTTLGTYGKGVNQFNRPSGIFVNSVGQIFVADTGNFRLVRINDMNGTGWTTFNTYTIHGIHRYGSPTSVFVNPAGQIFMTDQSNQRIVRLNDMAGTEPILFSTRRVISKYFEDGPGWAAIFLNVRGEIFLANYARNAIMHATTPLTIAAPKVGENVHLVDPIVPAPVSPSETDPLFAQDEIKGIYEGPLGPFVVNRHRFADFPPCPEPYRPAKNYKTSDLYSSLFGDFGELFECADGRLRVIDTHILDAHGYPISLGKRYFVGPAKVAFVAPLDRLVLFTVAGKPALAQLSPPGWFEHLRLVVIERFPRKDQPGIMVFIDDTMQSLEEAAALAARIMRR